MKFILTPIFALLLFSLPHACLSLGNPPPSSTSPTVVVSITPFYALVAAIMEGIGKPQLLVQPGASPHQYALKTSQIQLIQKAQILFWGGPALETFLVKPLQTVVENKPFPIIVEFDKTPGLLLLPLRENPLWEPHIHSNIHGVIENNNQENADMHFWLDPKNALILVNSIVHALATLDPQHVHQYQKNGKNLTLRLKQLDAHIAAQLKGVKTIPYIVFHDAYQYFEHRYGLNRVGAISLHPELPISAKRLKTIQEIMQKTNAHCVFTEPQFQPKLVQSLILGTRIKTETLDPLGSESENNANGYFKLLENLANSIKFCLSDS